MDVLFKLSIAILIGIVGGRAANLLKLPNVSGYIIAGLLIGPSFAHLFNASEMAGLSIISEIALAAIAFSIGSEFRWADIKKTGKDVLLITTAEVIGAVLLVFLVMFGIFRQPFAFSLIIASMSAATAPAGILMVIRELKAQGPLVRTILPVVAIDDALGIMVFGISLSIVRLTTGAESFSVFQIIWAPLYEILGSILLGTIIGFVMSFLSPRTKGRDELLSLVLAFILLGTGAAKWMGVSPLLTCMMIGAVLVNVKQNANRVFNLISDFTPPINLLFFTIAGASLDLSILSKVGLIGVGYILARAAGKIVGATIGARYVKATKKVVKYLGMSLLTQGGISIGLSLIVARELPRYSESIITVILFSVLFYEIAGPVLAKIAIQRAGEENGALKSKKEEEKSPA
ncbi:MAG TPA: cation:proton antiporter [Fastidiosipila sp.]|nr:cation:proton antiporter [Fastidiosipila sp.]